MNPIERAAAYANTSPRKLLRFLRYLEMEPRLPCWCAGFRNLFNAARRMSLVCIADGRFCLTWRGGTAMHQCPPSPFASYPIRKQGYGVYAAFRASHSYVNRTTPRLNAL